MAYEAVISAARVRLVKQRERAGGADGVLEGFVLRPCGLPFIVKIDKKAAILMVDEFGRATTS